MLAAYLWLIRIGRAEEDGLYPPYLSYVARRPVESAVTQSLATAPARQACRRASSCPRTAANHRASGGRHRQQRCGHGTKCASG